MTIRLILAGCGNMGYAMLKGWLDAGKLAKGHVLVVEPNDELRERAEALGCQGVADAAGIPANASPQLIVLAVKPQVIRAVAEAYRRFADGRTTYVSVAAGTSVATLEDSLGGRPPVMRCMPNTPAAIGKGMMVVFSNPQVGEAVKQQVLDLLSASGEVATIADEKLMDAVTAVSGSGPAYIFHFIEALTAAAQQAGLPEQTAKLLAMQTVYGAATLAAQSGEEPGVLRQQVTSPNGTTAAALGVLMGDDRLTRLVTEAVEAARLRSIELGR
ncbi:pyrroline-5-carboxylate reductase [Manganibacter manganicus]|uniref:Pyrroline-5-carboxylate reductase n=1 Tax=Manganibacter manganicus TaxID=1873176 RepID=A0A1V8RPW6_9HYPH|nr:pyrroline-5-carboxylate reductase [Pseudaminobacter manganicus]OQM75242.1 pyrroline-5-carboxylate reductase [Pseudaminobacter manganicus]